MASKRVVKCLDTPDHTLKLGWGDAGEGASLQVGGPRGAGELGIVHVGLVRDTAVNGVTSHRSVPLPRTARQHHLLLQKKQSSIRLPKRALIHRCATTAERSDPSFRMRRALQHFSSPSVPFLPTLDNESRSPDLFTGRRVGCESSKCALG